VKDAPDPLKKFVCVVVQYVVNVCSEMVGIKINEVSLAKEEDAAGLSGSQCNGLRSKSFRWDSHRTRDSSGWEEVRWT
jgi:hypothetical protein